MLRKKHMQRLLRHDTLDGHGMVPCHFARLFGGVGRHCQATASCCRPPHHAVELWKKPLPGGTGSG